MVTTVVNAYLRPACRPYLEGLAGTAESVVVMTSAGGLVDLDTAASTPARLLLSGPAREHVPPPPSPWHAGTPTRSASTWVAPAPTSA